MKLFVVFLAWQISSLAKVQVVFGVMVAQF